MFSKAKGIFQVIIIGGTVEEVRDIELIGGWSLDSSLNRIQRYLNWA